jgi:hypothetical protein
LAMGCSLAAQQFQPCDFQPNIAIGYIPHNQRNST